MNLSSTQDLLYLTLSIAVIWISVFLCWALYELGRLLHQLNRTLDETRQKITRLEQAVLNIRDRIEVFTSSLGVLIEGSKAVINLFTHTSEKHSREKR